MSFLRAAPEGNIYGFPSPELIGSAASALPVFVCRDVIILFGLVFWLPTHSVSRSSMGYFNKCISVIYQGYITCLR